MDTTRADTVCRVPFVGARSGTAPLTWGQRWMWDEAWWFRGDHAHLNMAFTVDVPPGCTVPLILDSIRASKDLSADTEAKLKDVVANFAKSFS